MHVHIDIYAKTAYSLENKGKFCLYFIFFYGTLIKFNFNLMHKQIEKIYNFVHLYMADIVMKFL